MGYMDWPVEKLDGYDSEQTQRLELRLVSQFQAEVLLDGQVIQTLEVYGRIHATVDADLGEFREHRVRGRGGTNFEYTLHTEFARHP